MTYREDSCAGTLAPIRSIPNLRAELPKLDELGGSRIRAADGWREPILASKGYRHIYDDPIAKGGWEFYELRPGLWLLIVNMVAHQSILRRHSFCDKLVFSSVLKGGIEINDPSGSIGGELANGYCTVYGMREGGFETTYCPGDTLKWVSVIVDRGEFGQFVNLDPREMPHCVSEFISGGSALAYRNVPLSNAAALVVSQIMECTYTGGSRLAWLTAKALELTCLGLFSLRDHGEKPSPADQMSALDCAMVEHARRLIERSLDRPTNVAELAATIGLTRQQLQVGFRHLYGTTVGVFRDKLRIERALELVQHSQIPIIDIGMETGYQHPGSFTRAFKAAFGASPSQVRRMAKSATHSRRS